jgi:methyl acetate hydrolase
MSIEAIESALRAAEATGVAPGFVAAARLPDGGYYLGAFGRRSADGPSPMQVDDLFWIASMTKLVTSLGAVQLVEQGDVSLDEDVAGILPEITDVPILEGFDADGAPRLRPARRPLTLRHLLTHTSGFGYPFFSETLGRYMAQVGAPTGAAPLLRLPRLFEAGEGWLYGVGIDLAGQIIERVSGEPLDVYLQRRVFDPLGMADTSFAPTPGQTARIATMHARQEGGGFSTLAPIGPMSREMLGGGGLCSTAPDYLKLLTALLDGGGGVVSPASVALLTRNQVGAIDDCGVLRTSSSTASYDFEPMPGVPKRWSLGLMVNEAPGPHGRGAGSGAWAGITNCYYWLDPMAGVAGLILMQLRPFADPAALDAFAAFEQAVYA